MDPATILMIASLATNLAGNVAGRPKKSKFNADKIFKALQNAEGQSLEAQLSTLRQTVGENSALRNLSGGAAAQIMAQAESGPRAASASRLASALADLKMKEAIIKDNDRNSQSQWLQGILGDAAGGMGAFAGALNAQKQNKSMMDLYKSALTLDGTPGKAAANSSPIKSMNLLGGSPLSTKSNASLGTALGGKVKGGGTNAIASFMPYRSRNRLEVGHNQWNKPIFSPLRRKQFGMDTPYDQ